MKRNLEYWLRWILMYPSALVATILKNIRLSLSTNFSSNRCIIVNIYKLKSLTNNRVLIIANCSISKILF